jgi:hypothetical protein
MKSQNDDALQIALHANPAQLTHPIKDIKEKWKLVPAFLKVCADSFIAFRHHLSLLRAFECAATVTRTSTVTCSLHKLRRKGAAAGPGPFQAAK